MSSPAQSQPPHPNLDRLRSIRMLSRSSRVQAFIDYMIAIHPAGQLPGRRHFEPTAIPALLSSVVLVNVEHAAAGRIRFLTKVVGQNIVEAAPARIANRYLDEFAAELGGADEILTTRIGVLHSGLSHLNQSAPLLPFAYKMRAVEYVHCPLASDGAIVDQIVSCFCYEPDLLDQ